MCSKCRLLFVNLSPWLSLFVTICHRLSPFVTICRRLSPLVAVCRRLSLFVAICRHLSHEIYHSYINMCGLSTVPWGQMGTNGDKRWPMATIRYLGENKRSKNPYVPRTREFLHEQCRYLGRSLWALRSARRRSKFGSRDVSKFMIHSLMHAPSGFFCPETSRPMPFFTSNHPIRRNTFRPMQPLQPLQQSTTINQQHKPTKTVFIYQQVTPSTTTQHTVLTTLHYDERMSDDCGLSYLWQLSSPTGNCRTSLRNVHQTDRAHQWWQ